MAKGVCTGYQAHVPRYVPFYLQNSKPCLPFLVFFEKGQENPQKNKDRTPKIPGKEGKNAQKKQGTLRRGKNKEFKNKQGKEGQGKDTPRNSDMKRLIPFPNVRVRVLRFGPVRMADCVKSSPRLISQKFQGFGGIWANSGKFGKTQGDSVEFSRVLHGA